MLQRITRELVVLRLFTFGLRSHHSQHRVLYLPVFETDSM